MQTHPIVQQMRTVSDGRAFLWASNDAGESFTIEIDADLDPHLVDRCLAEIGRGGPAVFLMWNGAEVTELADAEEAYFLAESTIRDRRFERDHAHAAE